MKRFLHSIVSRTWMCACMCVLAPLAVDAQNAKIDSKEYDGFWKMVSRKDMSFGRDIGVLPDVKAIGNNAFCMLQFNTKKVELKGTVLGKGGYFSPVSETRALEGKDTVWTRMEGERMIVNWKHVSGAKIEETWERFEPEYNMACLFAAVNQQREKHAFTGVWKMKEMYIMQNNSPHYETVKEKYKVIGSDMYFGFYTVGEEPELGYLRGWYGAFKYISDEEIAENGGAPSKIIWSSEDEYIYVYCPNKEKAPEFFIYEVWSRAELPAYAKTAFKALRMDVCDDYWK